MNVTDTEEFFKELYRNFNERNIEAVIAQMNENVQWANGMEGGYVHGHDGVLEYWTRQFTLFSAQVTPVAIEQENGLIKIKLRQVVYDMNDNLLADEYIEHIFELDDNNKISAFHIGGKKEPWVKE